MSYLHIGNLYKDQDILLFRECYALEKLHGTSAHISWDGYVVKFFSGAASHTQFVKLFDVEALTAKFTELVGHEPVKVFGEAYGGKLQGMRETYGPNLRFTAFDVQIAELWLSVPQADQFVQSLGLEFVYYTRIATTEEALNAARDAFSVQAVRNGITANKIQEGVVLRPLVEFRKNNGSRVIAKHKRAEFIETQTVRNVMDPAELKVIEDAELAAAEWVTHQRLMHVLDKIPTPYVITQTRDVVHAMTEDVNREGEGEIVKSKQLDKAIGKRAAALFKQHIESQMQFAEPEPKLETQAA